MTQPDDVQARNARVIAEFRANRGRVGGDFAGAPLLLLHTVGARTGKPRVSPAMYLPDDSRYLIFATNGGADDHPAWYRNLTAHPSAQIEVGDQVIGVHATELHGRERDDKYTEQARRYAGLAVLADDGVGVPVGDVRSDARHGEHDDRGGDADRAVHAAADGGQGAARNGRGGERGHRTARESWPRWPVTSQAPPEPNGPGGYPKARRLPPMAVFMACWLPVWVPHLSKSSRSR